MDSTYANLSVVASITMSATDCGGINAWGWTMSYLVIDRIVDTEEMEEEREGHGILQAATYGALFTSHTDINAHPEDEVHRSL